VDKAERRWRAYLKCKRLTEQGYGGNSDWHDRQLRQAFAIEEAYGGFDAERDADAGIAGITHKDVRDAAWTIVRRENMELRESHPKVYNWARAYIDSLESQE
jgi:hypothetical protein